MATPRRTDLIGRRFGALVVLAFDGLKNGAAYWLCACKPLDRPCDATTVVRGDQLRDGSIVSCGCSRQHRAGKTGRAERVARLAAALFAAPSRRCSLRTLAQELAVAPLTVRADLAILERAGLVCTIADGRVTMHSPGAVAAYRRRIALAAGPQPRPDTGRTPSTIVVAGVARTRAEWAAALGMTRGSLAQRALRLGSWTKAIERGPNPRYGTGAIAMRARRTG